MTQELKEKLGGLYDTLAREVRRSPHGHPDWVKQTPRRGSPNADLWITAAGVAELSA